MSFAHLHLHTQYSLLDGANKISDLMPRVKELGMPAVAMTDHGNMFGAIDFYKAAIAHGVKPIIGCEVYVAPGDRRERQRIRIGDHEAGNFHLILLAMNQEGYKNLCRLVSLAYMEGFYYKPRIDKSLLKEFNSGLIALSGCLASEVNRALAAGSLENAQKIMEEYRSMFGDRYYIEIQDNHLDDQEKANIHLIQLANKLGLPMVATNDCHYLHKGDHHAHEALLCIQTQSTIYDEKRWSFGTDQLYVKSASEMLRGFKDQEEAIKNTLDVAERCNLEFSFGKYSFPVWSGTKKTVEEELEDNAQRGFNERFTFQDETKEKQYRNRLREEIDTICAKGLASYFLIVADFTNWAKEQGIPVGPGRGSVAGSLVAYCLKITNIDPIPYNLLFERFINPERMSMPDIDMDFCFEQRNKVIDYVKSKYGEDHVSQIITFGSMKGKSAIKDVGRALGVPFIETNQIAKLYPPAKYGREYSLHDALEMVPDLKKVQEKNDKLFEFAFKLEGLMRHASKHAAGIVIGPRPLIEDVPLFKDRDGNVMTQYSMTNLEDIGLIKFDFLGLKTLTLIDKVIKAVKNHYGEEISFEKGLVDDPDTYKLIASGDTIGVFQMESEGMRKLIGQFRPSEFEDLISILALYRPGPLDSGMVDEFIRRKNGLVEVKYLLPQLESILKTTYGVIVYQEQVMQIAQVLAGYSLGEADNLRRAMGKKDPEKMGKEKKRFLEGAKKLKIDDALASEVFGQMETFAQYGFNKSHSAAYAMISYQTAYLKAKYREEFMAELMNIEMSDTDKTFKNIAVCRERGIDILPPSINESAEGFSVVYGSDSRSIRFGLGGVKGLGAVALGKIFEGRKKGNFTSLADFLRKTRVNKKVTEALIKCGAFDHFSSRRRQLDGLEEAAAWAGSIAVDDKTGQIGLFARSEPKLPPESFWSEKEKLLAERDALGFYVTQHPLDRYENQIKNLENIPCWQLREAEEPISVVTCGIVQNLRPKVSKKGNKYALFTLEDKTGTMEVCVWPETFDKFEANLNTDDPICIIGNLQIEEEIRRIVANEILPIESYKKRFKKDILISIQDEDFNFYGLQRILESIPGDSKVYVRFGQLIMKLPYSIYMLEDHVGAIESLGACSLSEYRE